jgi:hypothetical protein
VTVSAGNTIGICFTGGRSVGIVRSRTKGHGVSVATSLLVCSRDEGIVQILAIFSAACLHASIVLNTDCAMNADN